MNPGEVRCESCFPFFVSQYKERAHAKNIFIFLFYYAPMIYKYFNIFLKLIFKNICLFHFLFLTLRQSS